MFEMYVLVPICGWEKRWNKNATYLQDVLIN